MSLVRNGLHFANAPLGRRAHRKSVAGDPVLEASDGRDHARRAAD